MRVEFEFAGKAAHASADPWEGVNALDAVIQTFNTSSMRPADPAGRAHPRDRHPGGPHPTSSPRSRPAPSTSGRPSSTTCGSCTSAWSPAPAAPPSDRLLAHGHRLRGALRAAQAERHAAGPLPRQHEDAGAVESPPLPDRMGSSDIGNVSQVIPAIQPMVQIAPPGTPIHSRDFEAAAVSTLARQGMCQAAKTMAMTDLRSARRSRSGEAGAGEFEAAMTSRTSPWWLAPRQRPERRPHMK